MKNLKHLFPILYFFLILSCDEFILKKTVVVKLLKGDIIFEPNTPSLFGTLNYTIKNRQKKSLQEIFFISHPQVQIDTIKYNGDKTRFDQGIGYGMGIYRIRIPVLPSESDAQIEITFHLNGPIREERFLLTSEQVFMDAKKIWLPVPFAETPSFLYLLKVSTPTNYISILGARIKEETIKPDRREIVWQSEIEDVLHTGNIFIGQFERVNHNDIFLYSYNPIQPNPIFSFCRKTINLFSNRIGKYPYSQIHIINELFQYKDIEEFIDGEAMANIIQLSPELSDTNSISIDKITNSPIPFVPRNNVAKLYEVLAHELTHAYLPTILKFNEDNYIEQEAFAEYAGLCSIWNYYPEIYKKFIDGNRIELINLKLSGQSDQRLFRYLYGVNSLHCAFKENPALFLDYINILIQKYRYIEVGPEELIQTANDVNSITSPSNTIIFTNAIALLGSEQLYNVELSFSNLYVTNFFEKYKTVEIHRQLFIQNGFPIPVDVILTYIYMDYSLTNIVHLDGFSNTNLICDNKVLSIIAKTGLEALEEKLSDNQVSFISNYGEDIAISSINNFYNNQKFNTRWVKIEKSNTSNEDEGFESLYIDRERSTFVSPSISFQFDRIVPNKKEGYIQAYKMIDNKPYSYVIFKFKKENINRIDILGIIDPLF